MWHAFGEKISVPFESVVPLLISVTHKQASSLYCVTIELREGEVIGSELVS